VHLTTLGLITVKMSDEEWNSLNFSLLNFIQPPFVCPEPDWIKKFIFSTASRSTLVPTQPPVQLVPTALSMGVK
jgi:hypothetical protein